ncbi:hypothetical protein [Enterococcus italicus]|uniref:hypothetical protein n=1 Tax=Enterococcus italicus TaxID=246144 RepID=UPI002074A96E|nr:hypothetical protein [Enterococcus italicus]
MAVKKAPIKQSDSVEEVPKVIEPIFDIDDLCQSKEFTRNEKDFLRAIVQKGESYSISDAKKILSKALKGEVK